MGFPSTFPATFPNGGGTDATVTPATIAAVADVGVGLGGDTTVGATVVAAVAALPQATPLGGSATVTPATIAATAAIPSPVFGGGGGEEGGGGTMTAGLFDGIRHPRIQVLAGFGSGGDPGAGYIHLDVGPGLGTGQLAGASADTDLTGDVRSISISQRGRTTDIDTADPVTCTIVLNNFHGNYDPTSAAGPYWGANLLSGQQEGIEDGTTDGWEVGGNCALASTTAQAHGGSRSLRLTSSAAGGLWANTTTATGGVRVAAGDPVRVSGWLRSATRSVSGIVCVMFWDAAGTYLGQTDSAPVATSTSAWVQVSTSTNAPTGAVYANAQVLFDSAIAASEVHYADDVTLEPTALTDGTPIEVRASWDEYASKRFVGELADVTLGFDVNQDKTAMFTCNDGFEKLGRAYLPVTTLARDGDTTGQRIGFLADQAGWPSVNRAIDTGYTELGPTILGETALELIHQTEQTEFGLLFVDGAGVLVFYDRYRTTTATRSTTVQATFGDTAVAGQIGLRELQMARSRDRTFNRVAVTRNPTPSEDEEFSDSPVEQVADDPTSQAARGILSFPATVGQLLRSDDDSLAMAEGLLERFKDVHNRISEIRVTLLTGPRETLLALGPLDRIAVVHDYGPNTISLELLIQGVTEEINVSPASWGLTFTTTPPISVPDAWILGTSQVGVGTLGW